MKNASLIINAVLAVAVVVLFVLHFSGKKSGSSYSGSSSSPSDLKVAYVNQDTVLKYYDFVKVNIEKLEAKEKQLSQALAARQQSLQREVQAYQQGANNLTRGQAIALEEDLQKKGQNLQMFQEQASQEMMGEQSRINEELYGKITTFLKDYSKERGIQVVIKLDRTSDLLYAGDSLDISKDVIAGLNEAWKAESAKTPAAKTDTTKVKAKK